MILELPVFVKIRPERMPLFIFREVVMAVFGGEFAPPVIVKSLFAFPKNDRSGGTRRQQPYVRDMGKGKIRGTIYIVAP